MASSNFSSRFNAKGKHIFITGGSQGLGLSLAELLYSKGADVTICARDKVKLEKAVEQIRASSSTSSSKVAFVSADMSSFEGARKALSIASGLDSEGEQIGRIPDAVFACAGGAKPGLFLDQDENDFKAGFQMNYMTALSTAHATTKLFVENKKVGGKLILTGSTVSFMGLIGYTQYSPMKFAIRGLVECLRQEYMLYEKRLHLTVQMYFPGTILSPGYEEEQKTKPAITNQIEGGGDYLTSMQCAKSLLKGVEKGQFYITSDFETELMRASTSSRGLVPANNIVLDRLKSFIGFIGLTGWRIFTLQSSIRKYADQHPEDIYGLK